MLRSGKRKSSRAGMPAFLKAILYFSYHVAPEIMRIVASRHDFARLFWYTHAMQPSRNTQIEECVCLSGSKNKVLSLKSVEIREEEIVKGNGLPAFLKAILYFSYH